MPGPAPPGGGPGPDAPRGGAAEVPVALLQQVSDALARFERASAAMDRFREQNRAAVGALEARLAEARGETDARLAAIEKRLDAIEERLYAVEQQKQDRPWWKRGA